jgi:hypothetical protein
MTKHRPILIIALFIAYAAVFCFGQGKNDYLILSSPLDYTIFNEY